MRVETSGTTIIEHKDTSVQYEIDAKDIYWELVDASERSMGAELRYEGTIEHVKLGALTWSLWEYPIGIQNYKDRDIGDHKLIQEFEFDLEHEPDPEEAERVGWQEQSEKEQIERMTEWFFHRYEDPQNQHPYAPKESEYNYTYPWGGPYEANDELFGAFGHVADEDVILKAVDVVQDRDGIFEWGPSSNHPDLRNAGDEYLQEIAERREVTAPIVEALATQIGERGLPDAQTPDAIRLKAEVAEYARDLGELTARIVEPRPHGGMGHNNPPEEILPLALVQNIHASITVIQNAAENADTDPTEVMEALGVLAKAKMEAQDVINQTWDRTKKGVSIALATTIVGGLTVLCSKVLLWMCAAAGLPLPF